MCRNSKTDRAIKRLSKLEREELKRIEFENYLRNGGIGNPNGVAAAERYGEVPFAGSLRDGEVEIIIVPEKSNDKPQRKKRKSAKKS